MSDSQRSEHQDPHHPDPENDLMSLQTDALRNILVEELLKSEISIHEGLTYALRRAREAGGTAGHKFGPKVKRFEGLIRIAKELQSRSKS